MNVVIIKARAMANFKETVDSKGGQFSEAQQAEFTGMISLLEIEKEKEGADVEYINSLISKLS